MSIPSIESELRSLSVFAPGGYYVALHLHFASARHTFRTYPDHWVQKYLKDGFFLKDPIVAWADANTGGIRWSDIDLPDPHLICTKAKTFGLKFGVVVSVNKMNKRSVATFARGDQDYEDSEVQFLTTAVERMHMASFPSVKLSGKMLEALRHIRAGINQAESAMLLGVTESALKGRVFRAKKILGARNSVHAAALAFELGLLDEEIAA